MKALVFAAGKGTRLKPITDSIPKALVPVCGKPLVCYVLEKLKKAGFCDVVVNVHHFAEQIMDFLPNAECAQGMNISFSDERSQLLETGGGIKRAEKLLGGSEPFLVHNVDILSNLDLGAMLKVHLEQRPLATLLVSSRKTARYLLFDSNDNLVGWTNTDTGEIRSPYSEIAGGDINKLGLKMYAFGGIHVISPEIFAMMRDMPDAFPIMDFYIGNCNRCTIKAYVKENLEMVDVGKLDTIHSAEDFVRRYGL